MSLFRNNMQKNRLFRFLRYPQKCVQLPQIMSVHRSVVGNAHFLKKRTVSQIQPLEILLDLFHAVHHGVPHHRNSPQRRFGAAFGTAIAAVEANAFQ